MWSLPPLPKGRTFIEMRPRVSSLTGNSCALGSTNINAAREGADDDAKQNRWDTRALPWIKRTSPTVSPTPFSRPDVVLPSSVRSMVSKSRGDSSSSDLSEALGPAVTFGGSFDTHTPKTSECPELPFVVDDDHKDISSENEGSSSESFETMNEMEEMEEMDVEPCYMTNHRVCDRKTVRFSDEIKIHHVSMTPEAVRTRTLSDEVKRRIFFGQKFAAFFEDGDEGDDELQIDDMDSNGLDDDDELKGEAILEKKQRTEVFDLATHNNESPPLPPASLWSNFFTACTTSDMCA